MIQTIIVVVITSNLELAEAPGNVLLQKKATELPRDSVANVSQVIISNPVEYLLYSTGFDISPKIDYALEV